MTDERICCLLAYLTVFAVPPSSRHIMPIRSDEWSTMNSFLSWYPTDVILRYVQDFVRALNKRPEVLQILAPAALLLVGKRNCAYKL